MLNVATRHDKPGNRMVLDRKTQLIPIISVATGHNRYGNRMTLDRKIKQRNKMNNSSKKVGDKFWEYPGTTRTKRTFHIIVGHL